MLSGGWATPLSPARLPHSGPGPARVTLGLSEAATGASSQGLGRSLDRRAARTCGGDSRWGQGVVEPKQPRRTLSYDVSDSGGQRRSNRSTRKLQQRSGSPTEACSWQVVQIDPAGCQRALSGYVAKRGRVKKWGIGSMGGHRCPGFPQRSGSAGCVTLWHIVSACRGAGARPTRVGLTRTSGHE